MRIAICIGTFQRPQLLQRLLAALRDLRFRRITTPTIAVIVVDNDVHGFVFTEIPSPQTAGVPFLVRVTAVDIATNRITDFTNAVSLRAAGPEGVTD